MILDLINPHLAVLKTFREKQAIFLIEQRKEEHTSKDKLMTALIDDLWSRRYGNRRISVPYEALQREVAKKLYWRHRLYCTLFMKVPDFSVTNPRWASCLHEAADMINNCSERGYLKCTGENCCDLLQITATGSEYGRLYQMSLKPYLKLGPLEVGLR